LGQIELHIEYNKSGGYFQKTLPVYTDLGELVARLKPGRETAEERTIACILGLALDDMAIAPTIYQRAFETGIGSWVSR
jgi:ornithine cyclodeaminase/alanine dehydrogenase-like protein (mu-crystallin family)